MIDRKAFERKEIANAQLTEASAIALGAKLCCPAPLKMNGWYSNRRTASREPHTVECRLAYADIAATTGL
jgi:hypothetical protein